MLAHLDGDSESSDYKRALSSLKRLYGHCSNADGTLRLFPQISVLIYKMYYNDADNDNIKNLVKKNESIGGVIRDVCNNENGIDFHKKHNTFQNIEQSVEEIENGFIEEMATFYNEIDCCIKQKIMVDNNHIKNKKLEFIESKAFDSYIAKSIILMLKSKYELSEKESENTVDGKATDFKEKFPSVINFYRYILCLAVSNKDNSKGIITKRKNSIWDSEICFPTGGSTCGKDNYLITNDAEIIKIINHNKQKKAITLEEYIEILKN